MYYLVHCPGVHVPESIIKILYIPQLSSFVNFFVLSITPETHLRALLLCHIRNLTTTT